MSFVSILITTVLLGVVFNFTSEKEALEIELEIKDSQICSINYELQKKEEIIVSSLGDLENLKKETTLRGETVKSLTEELNFISNNLNASREKEAEQSKEIIQLSDSISTLTIAKENENLEMKNNITTLQNTIHLLKQEKEAQLLELGQSKAAAIVQRDKSEQILKDLQLSLKQKISEQNNIQESFEARIKELKTEKEMLISFIKHVEASVKPPPKITIGKVVWDIKKAYAEIYNEILTEIDNAEKLGTSAVDALPNRGDVQLFVERSFIHDNDTLLLVRGRKQHGVCIGQYTLIPILHGKIRKVDINTKLVSCRGQVKGNSIKFETLELCLTEGIQILDRVSLRDICRECVGSTNTYGKVDEELELDASLDTRLWLKSMESTIMEYIKGSRLI